MAIERVLVVGGGIAGLATAAGLTRAGIASTVVEHADEWRPVGAGIVLGVNAMSVMRGLGLAEAVADRGERLGAGSITDGRGNTLGRTDFALLEAEFGPTIALHRADLHAVLLDGAKDAAIELGTSVSRIAQNETGVDVELTDGRLETFDLVIGADGLRSRVRELVFGPVDLVYAGYTCWRMVVHSPVAQPEMCEMWGRGQRFGIVPIGKNRLYCFAVANAPAGEADPEADRLARFCARFGGFGGAVPALLAALVHRDELIHNDLEEVPVGHWFDGRVVLIGDAAHAMTPNMGQGAAMALEDSAVLVELLGAGEAIAETLGKYRARRETRVRWVQKQSRRIGRIGQLDCALACRLRNAAMRIVPNRLGARALRKLARQPI